MTFERLKKLIEQLEREGMQKDAEIILQTNHSMFNAGYVSWFIPSKDVLIIMADNKTERPAKAFKTDGEPFWE